jgi:hypothetical protein
MVAEVLVRLTFAGLLLAAALAAGCAPSTPTAQERGMAVVVFIDFSQSVGSEDLAGFRREIDQDILPSLAAGDRLLIAPIHDRTLTDFRPLLDANLPPKPRFSGWLDNVMKFNRQTKEVESRVTHVKDKVAADVARVFAKGRSSPYTDVLSSMLIAQKLFHDETRQKVLIIMSDMIEDSPAYRFDQISWSPATIEKMLGEMEAKSLIPKLPGVCIYVSGASAGSAAMAEHIGRFWQAYFRRTGADMDPARYSHVLLHWPPSSACRRAGPPPAV